MRDVVGLILADSDSGDNLWGLAKNRTLGAVPILGKYRLIDFEINHMQSQGMDNIIVASKQNFQSLLHHMGIGENYNLARKNAGIHLLTPYNQDKWGDGSLFRSSLRILKNLNAKYLIISSSNIISDLDYNKMLEFHIKSNSSITVLSVKGQGVQFAVNQKGRITNISYENTDENFSGLVPVFIIGVEDYKRNVMATMADDMFTILRENLNEQDIFYYEADKIKYECIDSVKKYFDYSMSILKEPENLPNLLTRIKDVPPTEYTKTAEISNSIFADGSKISGNVDNSIIGTSVEIASSASIKNSIIFAECKIAEDVVLENCIVDKGVKISKGKRLIGEKDVPIVIERSTII